MSLVRAVSLQGMRPSGSSRREDVLDLVMCLRHPEDYSSTEGARFELHFDKTRGLYGDDAKPFEARLEVRDGAALWTCQRTRVTPSGSGLGRMSSRSMSGLVAKHTLMRPIFGWP